MAADLGRDGRPLSASMQEHAEQTRRLALFTKLQLQDLDTIKLSFASLYTPIYKEKGLVSRARAQVILLGWYNLEKVLDEEAELLDTLVTWLNEALTPISELLFHLEVIRGLLVDIERCYQVDLTGSFFHRSHFEHLQHSLAGVGKSLNQIATVLKYIQQ